MVPIITATIGTSSSDDDDDDEEEEEELEISNSQKMFYTYRVRVSNIGYEAWAGRVHIGTGLSVRLQPDVYVWEIKINCCLRAAPRDDCRRADRYC